MKWKSGPGTSPRVVKLIPRRAGSISSLHGKPKKTLLATLKKKKKSRITKRPYPRPVWDREQKWVSIITFWVRLPLRRYVFVYTALRTFKYRTAVFCFFFSFLLLLLITTLSRTLRPFYRSTDRVVGKQGTQATSTYVRTCTYVRTYVCTYVRTYDIINQHRQHGLVSFSVDAPLLLEYYIDSNSCSLTVIVLVFEACQIPKTIPGTGTTTHKFFFVLYACFFFFLFHISREGVDPNNPHPVTLTLILLQDNGKATTRARLAKPRVLDYPKKTMCGLTSTHVHG